MTEPFLTTVVGSMPKLPWPYRQVSLSAGKTDIHGQGGDWALQGPELEQAQDDATRLAIHDQERAGIDIISVEGVSNIKQTLLEHSGLPVEVQCRNEITARTGRFSGLSVEESFKDFLDRKGRKPIAS